MRATEFSDLESGIMAGSIHWAATVLICVGMVAPVSLVGDEIVLRTGKKLTDAKILSCDEDGLVLEGGQRLTLDQVRKATTTEATTTEATTSEAIQSQLSDLLPRLGEPLFRLEVRVKRKDFENVAGQLEQLFPIFAQRSGRSAARVHFAAYRLHARQGRMSLAIRSWFHLYRIFKTNGPLANEISGWGVRFEAGSGMSRRIVPFGFSEQRVLENWDSILSSYLSLPEEAGKNGGKPAKDRPSGLDFYFFALAKIADFEPDAKLASRRLALHPLDRILLENLLISESETATAAEVQQALVRQTGFRVDQDTPAIRRATFQYLQGRLEIRSPNSADAGLLNLLRIHAEQGRRLPAISAAALFAVYQFLKNVEPERNAESVAQEILSRYPSSYFSNRLRMSN